MEIDPSFRQLVAQVRTGDQAAAAELVRRYEPEVRRYVRLRLTDSKLTRILDSVDICQSVLTTFFVRVAAGQFDLDEPEQLMKLLVTMAHNKIVDHARRPENRRTRDADPNVWEAMASDFEGPLESASRKELLREVEQRLSAEERELARHRASGLSWQSIAAAIGSTPEAARKRLERAIDRVCSELGIDREAYA